MKKGNVGRIVSYILILMVIVATIGVFAYFTNGFTSDFKTFYVSVNGKDVMTSQGGLVATTKEPLAVDVKYTFGAFNKDENKGYSVKIVPNKIENSDFTYTIDGESKSFQSETDISNGFEIVKGEKSFTVTPKGETIVEVLSAIYSEYINQMQELMLSMQKSNPTEAIGKAKELIEACCKTILDELKIEYKPQIRLYRKF